MGGEPRAAESDSCGGETRASGALRAANTPGFNRLAGVHVGDVFDPPLVAEPEGDAFAGVDVLNTPGGGVAVLSAPTKSQGYNSG